MSDIGSPMRDMFKLLAMIVGFFIVAAIVTAFSIGMAVGSGH